MGTVRPGPPEYKPNPGLAVAAAMLIGTEALSTFVGSASALPVLGPAADGPPEKAMFFLETSDGRGLCQNVSLSVPRLLLAAHFERR